MEEKETAHAKAGDWWKFDSVEEMWSQGVAVCSPGRGLQSSRVKEGGGRGKVAICGLPTGLLVCAKADVTQGPGPTLVGMGGAAGNGVCVCGGDTLPDVGMRVRLVLLKQQSCLLGHG